MSTICETNLLFILMMKKNPIMARLNYAGEAGNGNTAAFTVGMAAKTTRAV